MTSVRILELINLFHKRVRDAVDLVKIHKDINLPNGPTEWWYQLKPAKGYLDKDQVIKYYLHGYGCEIIHPQFHVDWDFGKNGEITGFDWWRLYLFALNNDIGYNEFRDKNFVQNLCQTEAESKRFYRKSGDQLYYIKLHPDA